LVLQVKIKLSAKVTKQIVVPKHSPKQFKDMKESAFDAKADLILRLGQQVSRHFLSHLQKFNANNLPTAYLKGRGFSQKRHSKFTISLVICSVFHTLLFSLVKFKSFVFLYKSLALNRRWTNYCHPTFASTIRNVKTPVVLAGESNLLLHRKQIPLYL